MTYTCKAEIADAWTRLVVRCDGKKVFNTNMIGSNSEKLKQIKELLERACVVWTDDAEDAMEGKLHECAIVPVGDGQHDRSGSV